MKRENDDAEFVQNLNNSFKKERGFQIKLNPDSEGKCLNFIARIIHADFDLLAPKEARSHTLYVNTV